MNDINLTKRSSLSLYVHNRPGVLARITLLFTRRSYNIDSLVVSAAYDPDFSWISIEASGDNNQVPLLIKQLQKLIDVVHVSHHARHLGTEILQRELALLKVCCSLETRTEILQIVDTFHCSPLDATEGSITIQIVGSPEDVEALERLLEPYRILESVRTGKVFIARGDAPTAGTRK
ncbi:acetolactate synthase small subunit [Candidatus Haliotispira prima]|uniref:Acetolactate synthase small subunit n=1 Tax=Candidatus Haliotispira prima TaxID=3034016 RepID=A0ABY8MI26_9SPIO|nr:acetolactate synthase small subunit [Candidatus Haliotispira prima]